MAGLPFVFSVLGCVLSTGCLVSSSFDAGVPATDAGEVDSAVGAPDADDAPFDGGPGSVGAAQVAVARAVCTDATHGPVVAAPTRGTFTSHLVGSWLLCSTSDPSDPAKSVVFSADGTWHYLIDDGHGGLVPGVGLASTGTWQLGDAMGTPTADGPSDMPTNGYVARYHMPGMGIEPNFDGFESSPDRMEIQAYVYTEWYVPLD